MYRPSALVLVLCPAACLTFACDEAPSEETTAPAEPATAAPDPATPPPAAPTAAACSAGSEEHPEREASIRSLLGETPTGARVLEDLGDDPVRFCFGETDHRFVVRRRLTLPMMVSELELVPTVGRMLDEVAGGSAIVAEIPADADCAELTDAALDRQAELFATEAQIRLELELPAVEYGFEPAFREASPDAREGVVLDYISRPDGMSGNPPAMRARFMAHCRQRRAGP